MSRACVFLSYVNQVEARRTTSHFSAHLGKSRICTMASGYDMRDSNGLTYNQCEGVDSFSQLPGCVA